MLKLLVPRESRSFAYIEGEPTFYVDDVPRVLSRTLTINPEVQLFGFDIIGEESGKRSGLLYHADKMYQIKGCDVPIFEAIKSSSGGRRGGEQPHGTQYLAKCKHELRVVQEFSEVLRREGFVPPQTSMGYYRYMPEFKERPVGASIFESKGDTRLDELLVYLENPIRFPDLNLHVPELYGLFYKLGFWTGRLKRVMDNNRYTWDVNKHFTNAHLGNYVVFDEDGEIMLGIVDLDSAVKRKDDTRMRNMQESEYRKLLEFMMVPDLSSKGFDEIISGYKIVVYSGSLDFLSAEYPMWYRERLKQGFKHGYENPQGACTIHLQDIKDAIIAGEEALGRAIGRVQAKTFLLSSDIMNKIRSGK